MAENWNKKESVEQTSTHWQVILVILAIILLPLAGGLALAYFYVNDASVLFLLTIGGLCLVALALPLGALFVLMRQSKERMKAKDQEAQL